MPRNRIKLIETIHVTQKTDRSHQYSSSPRLGAGFSVWRGTSFSRFLVAAKRRGFEEFGGLFATDCSVQQVAVNSIFILKSALVRSVVSGRGLATC
jgi:hypothetical protein